MPQFASLADLATPWQRLIELAQIIGRDRDTGLELIRVSTVVISLIGLAWLVARGAWLLMPSPVPTIIEIDAIETRGELFAPSPTATTDIQQLRSQSLFGNNTSPRAPVKAAPPPSKVAAVALRLIGVVYSDNPQNARAVISSARRSGQNSGQNSDQKLYRIGDALPGSTDSLPVTLTAVGRRQIHILRADTEEIIKLHIANDNDAAQQPNDAQSNTASANTDTPTTPDQVQLVDRRADSLATEIAGRYAQQLLEDPTSLGQLISYQVARLGDSNSALIGFRIRPKKSAQDFYRLGLRAGDVVTAINGVELSSYTALSDAQSLLQGATEASVRVLRRKKSYDILLALQ